MGGPLFHPNVLLLCPLQSTRICAASMLYPGYTHVTVEPGPSALFLPPGDTIAHLAMAPLSHCDQC